MKLFYNATEVTKSVIFEIGLLYYRCNTTKSVIIETGLNYYIIKKYYITLHYYSLKNI